MLQVLSTAGLPALFASRVFLPAFAAAFVLRFGPEYGWDEYGALALIGSHDVPPWFVSDPSLLALGFLAFCELIAHRNHDAREILASVDQYGKPCLAALTFLGIVSLDNAAFATPLLTVEHASVFAIVPLALVVVGTYVLARARNLVMLDFFEADDGNETGIMGILSWGEDLFSVLGVWLLVLFPMFMLVVLAMVSGLLLYLRRRAEQKEELAKIDCAGCGASMYRPALACPQCHCANPRPTSLNWLGASTMTPIARRDRHAHDLAAAKRCPVCATRFKQRTPLQDCTACQHRLFHDPAFVKAYDNRVARDLPLVLIVCAGLSLVPVVGLVIGILYYRLKIVSPYRRYIPRVRTFFLRWTIRIVMLALVLLHLVPILGALSVPCMAIINFTVYRSAFLKMTAIPGPETQLSPQVSQV